MMSRRNDGPVPIRRERSQQDRQEIQRPHDADAERAVLGAALIDPDAVGEIITLITPDDFYIPAHKNVCEAIFALYAQGIAPDLVTVCDELRRNEKLDGLGGVSFVSSLANHVPHTAHAARYAGIVARLAQRGAALDAWSAGLTDLYDGHLEPSAAIARVMRRFQDVNERIGPSDDNGEIMSLQQLMQRDSPELVWPIAGILSEGLAIIGAPPKTGKSALALQLVLACGAGSSFLGNYTVAEQGQALYLALEDPIARLKQRVSMQLRSESLPPGVDITLSSPPMLDGGLLRIESWLRSHQQARMVVIDTLGRFRGVGSQIENGNLFAADYDDMARLQKLALAHHVAIVVLHHLTKNTGVKTDPLEMLSGTMGTSAPADIVWIIQRERNDEKGKLHIVGRDVEEQTLAVAISRDTLTWRALGNAAELEEKEGWREVWDAIGELGGEASPAEIAAVTPSSRETLKMRCVRMKNAGYLVSTGNKGRYQRSTPKNSGELA